MILDSMENRENLYQEIGKGSFLAKQTYISNDGSTSVTSNKGASFVYRNFQDVIQRTANATRMQMQPISHAQGSGQGTVIGPGSISSGPITPDDGSTAMCGESYDTGIGYLCTDSFIIDGNSSKEAIVM